MAMTDKLKSECQIIKDKPFAEKVQFFLDYYKWVIAVGVILILVIGSVVQSVVTAKETVLSGQMLNCYTISETPFADLKEDFLASLQKDSGKYEMEINTMLTYTPDDLSAAESNYNTVQMIGVEIASHRLDFVVGDQSTMVAFACSDSFCDLSEILTPKQLEMYQPYLRYIDMADLESAKDPAKPELMENPVPVLIDMSGCTYLTNTYSVMTEPLLLGVAVNVPRQENVCKLIDFLMDAK